MKEGGTGADLFTEEEAPVIWLWGEPCQESYPQMTQQPDEWSAGPMGDGQ